MISTAPFTVTDYHRALLSKIREDLRTGTIPPERFNMQTFARPGTCGTAHCIAGWMQAYAAEAGESLGFAIASFATPFTVLFYPYGAAYDDLPAITPQQAIVAIGLWLDTGRVDWPGIVESVR